MRDLVISPSGGFQRRESWVKPENECDHMAEGKLVLAE
jgi:hypothetical protein